MKQLISLLILFFNLILVGCKDNAIEANTTEFYPNTLAISTTIGENIKEIKEVAYTDFIIKKYKNIKPSFWGEHHPNILSKVPTTEKIIYLTFDACGSATGNKLDRELIDFLSSENINATLFINERWIDSNLNDFIELSKNPLFEIENHGTQHKPLSINGQSVYNIKGTTSSKEIFDEVENNSLKIEKLTGRKPKFFRSGTAYYDDVAINMVNDMGYKIAGFNILGDAGATLKKNQIINKFSSFDNGSIFLFHMNHPESDTFEGLREVIPTLKAKGYKFLKLDEVLK